MDPSHTCFHEPSTRTSPKHQDGRTKRVGSQTIHPIVSNMPSPFGISEPFENAIIFRFLRGFSSFLFRVRPCTREDPRMTTWTSVPSHHHLPCAEENTWTVLFGFPTEWDLDRCGSRDGRSVMMDVVDKSSGGGLLRVRYRLYVIILVQGSDVGFPSDTSPTREYENRSACLESLVPVPKCSRAFLLLR